MSDRPEIPYVAPLADILNALNVVGLPDLLALADFHGVDSETVSAVVTEFGRFANQVIAPTDAAGDGIGASFDTATGTVRTAPGFADAYLRYVQAGWGALQFPEDVGGGGLPVVVGFALQEMWASANVAFSLCPVLTQSAIELLLRWGSDEQHARFLPKLLTGEWSGTMNLTEPDAGSDLGAVRTLATLRKNGNYSLRGTKIFISWGEHDLSDNIVHLVLARTPDAPAGTRGLSLFVVPKYLVGSEGELGEANSLRCAHIEEKVGLHGSPTCVMEYDGADGELVGELHGGLKAMFTMMNIARLSIGLEGPAVAERAFQQARTYANERLQGHRPGGSPNDHVPIVAHPDIRRMLLQMRTLVLASRLLIYFTVAEGDLAQHGADEAVRERANGFYDLLTPVAKAWSTDAGFTAASLAMQIFGGSAYLEETGIAQRFRDSRVFGIYEGTNGIQAIDLVTRKLARDGGRQMQALLELIDETVATTSAELTASADALREASDLLAGATVWMVERAESAPDDALAGATSYLELVGITVGGWLLLRRALGAADEERVLMIGEANFFATEVLSRAGGLRGPIIAGAARLAALADAPF